MPATTDITLDMLLAEQLRICKYMRQHYPKMVKERKITPYERSQREACNKKLIHLLKLAIANKNDPTKPKLLQILNTQP